MVKEVTEESSDWNVNWGRREAGNDGEEDENQFLNRDAENCPAAVSSLNSHYHKRPLVVEICSLARGNLMAILFLMLLLVVWLSLLVEPRSVATESKGNHETDSVINGESSSNKINITIPPKDDDYWNVPIDLKEKSTEPLEPEIGPKDENGETSSARDTTKAPSMMGKNQNRELKKTFHPTAVRQTSKNEDEFSLRYEPIHEKNAKAPAQNVTLAPPALGIPVANIWTLNISATMKAPLDKQVHPNLVFIKGVKVGGTSVAVALNQVAEQYNIKLATTHEQTFAYDGACRQGSIYFHHGWKAPWMEHW